MFDEQDRQYFYNEFKNNGYEVGSYDDFKKDLKNKEDRDWYYNEAKNMGYDVGTQADFDKMVLEPASSTSGGGKQVDSSATTQSVGQKASTETKPQVAQPAKKQKTTDKEPGLIAKVLDMIPTGVQTSNGTYQPSPEIPQPVVKGEEMPVKEEASSSSSANAAPVTTPTGVVNNEGLMDAKLANYIENWKQRPDKQSTYFENLVADLLADGTANSNEEAVNMVMPALRRYANRSAMDVTNQVVSSLPDDTVQDAEQSIGAQWYSHGVQDKLKQEADSMGISYDDYVALFLKPAMVQSLVNKYGPNYRNIAEGIATRLYAHDENVQDRLMNQDINDALSSVINKYVNPSVVDEYNKAQEAGSKAFTEGMEGSQFIPANLRLGTALGAQYEANEAKDPAKVLSGLQKKFGKLYRNPKFLNDMSNAAFKVMQRYGLNGTQSSDPKQFKPMINAAIKNELDQLEIKGMMPKGSAEYIMKTGLGNTIVGKIIRKAVQTDYQNWLEDIANQQYQPGFWENVASGALTFAGDAWSYWLPGAAGGKLTKSMVAKAEGKLAGDLMAKGMERKIAERAAKVLIGKSKAAALKSGAVHGAVTFGGQSAISKPIDEVYRTGQFDENGKIYNPSVGKVIANTLGEVAKQSAVGAIMQGGTIANMVGKGRGLATNILADVGGKVVDSGIMTGHQMLERMAQDPNFKPTGKDAAESFLESMANLTAVGLPGMVGKYARFKDAREFNKKFDFTDQDIAELKRFGYDGLRDAFEKMGIGEYAVVGENAQRLDGQLTQKYMDLMSDKSVSEVLKAKMMAVVEGKRPSSFSPVVDSIIVQPMDHDGKVYLETLNKDGGIVDRKEFSSLDEAQKADKKLEYEKTLGLASVLEGEFHNEFTQEHLEGLYNKAAQKYNMGEKLTDEDKAAVYLHQNAGAIKEIMDKQQKGIILTDEEQKQINVYRHYYDSALENSSVMREFVNTFEDSHGVARGTLRKALESKDKKYSPLVESYLKELYNSIELKREMKQTMDDLYNTSHGNEQKRIEQGGVEGEKPTAPVEGSAGGQEPPVSEGPSPYQGNVSSGQGEGVSTANSDNSSADVITSDAFVMGQNAYKNGDSEALQAIDYNSDLATGRLQRAFADNEKMPDIVANAYNEGRDMEQFVAQRASSLTPAQKEAISKYVEAMDAKKGAIDALQHADDGYGEALKQQLWPYQTVDGNIVPATLDSGKQVFLKKANEYGGAFVVVPDEQGQPMIKQVSNAEIKEVGAPVSLDEYIENAVAQQKDARAQQFISQFDGSGLKPNDRVTVAMEEGDANIDMTFAGYSEDGKIVLTDGKDYLPLSKEEFAAWRKNALDNTINEHLDAEDDEREQKAVSQAEADKKQRYANGIVGLSEGQPDYSSKNTDPNVAAEYLQEQFGEDHGKLLNLVNGSRDDIETQLANKKKAAAEYQNWLDTNADLDPEKAKKVEDELSLVNEQIADLDARFKNWNTIRNSVMTPDEVKAMKEERKAEVEKAGVDETAIVPSDDFHVLVLEDKELKKQYPTMAEATDYITSQRKDIYHTQEDVERKINGVNDMLEQYINGDTEQDPTQLMELNTTKAQLEALQTNLSVAAKGLKAQANKLSKLYKTEVRQQEMEELGMTPSEQRKVLVADALKKKDLKAIKEIYKDASTDVMDLAPRTLEEFVSERLFPHSLNAESLAQELGSSNFRRGIGSKYDTNKFNYLLAKKGEGLTINELAKRVWEDLSSTMESGDGDGLQSMYTDQDVRNAILDMFKTYDTVREMRNVTLLNRIAAAENELSGEEEWYEQQKEREIYEKQKEIDEYNSYIQAKELSLPSESELDHIYGLEYDRMMEIEDREREYQQYVKSILSELADYDDRSNEEGYGGGSSLGSDSSRRGVDEGNSQGEEVGNGEASSESEIGEGSDSGRKGRQETGSLERGESPAVRGSHLPQEASFGERLKSAIAETETEPTEAQKKAGNYKKGHLSFGGYDYTVETPKGVTRSGKDEHGKPWSVTMHDTYGYILGKIGVDGDHIDMFINDDADLDTFDGNVYVVDQVNPETGEFDEHKVMYGYPSEEAATEAYLANYSKGWKGLGKVTSVPKATFDKWLESSDRKTKPFAEYAMVQKEQAKFDRDVKEVKPSEMTEAQKVAYDAVSTMLKKAGIPVKVVSNEDMVKVAEAQDKGVVYGYTDGNEIVLNKEHLNPNTPIHEYQHLWRTAAKNMNPELIEHGDKLIMQTQLFADLKQDPNYNHLTDEQICDEAFARLTGEDGAAILEQMAKDAIKENPLDTAKELSVINKLKEWLKKFWYWTLDTFTKWKPEDIKKMTLEDIRNLVLRDLANGVDPRNVKFRMTKEDAVSLRKQMADNAEQERILEHTEENWLKEFGKDSRVTTPIGSIKLGENQYKKAGRNDRIKRFGLLKPTLERPDVILEKSAPKEGAERQTKYLFIKSFKKADGNKILNYESITVKQGEEEVAISAHQIDPSKVVKELTESKVLWNRFRGDSNSLGENQGSALTPSANNPSGKDSVLNPHSDANIRNNIETTKGNGGNLSVEDKIKAVSQQFGVDEADVAMYANAIKKGSTAEAARARANIKRHLLQANEDKISSLKKLLKYTKPVNEALKENFGDVDAMIEERVKQVEAQRNAMEAARKRAEEEEAKRQKHLEELSVIPDDQLDKQYMDALAKGDDATAREMLDEAARRKGYDDTESAYQGVGAWAAPGNPGYESDKARRDDWESSGSDVNLEDIALGYTPQPDDYFSHPERYSQNTPHGLESVKAINEAIDAIKNGEKDVKVKVYRAVPTLVKEGKLRNGDWVTPSKKYAEMHGTNRLEGKYRIIEDEVPATQLWWDGNDANEFGFDDGKAYKYKNAKNNRKLNDLVTYDNKGDVIPPSKRFNSRKSDVRFMFAGEKGAAEADKADEQTIRMDNLDVAKQMEKAKKDAKIIKMATGWEKGVDGKWRYEMPDAKIKDTIDVGGGNIVKRFEEDMLWTDGKLEDAVDAPKLFEAYPQLKNIKIHTDVVMNDMPSNGEYNPQTKTITIHADELKYLNSILNHEIQHVIQREEGFAHGGTPEQVERDFNAAKAEWKARSYAFELEEKAKEMGGEYNQSEVEKALIQEYKDMDMPEFIPDKETRIKGFNYFARGYADRSMDDAIKRFRLDRFQRTDFDSYQEYRKLAGEVEARNVEKRLGMTDEERRNSLASETEDVNRDEQIVMNGNDASYSIVKDPETIKKLDKEDTVKVYRAMQVGEDGKLYPPMAAKVKGKFVEPIELGKWEQADERPELADDKGMFTLNKGNGKSLKAAYNPYLHTSRTPLNDQFSEAQNRPNIVTVEVEVPKSELTSGYKADKAKDAVGEVEWKAGIIQGQLTGKRKVVLSRWDKPVRIVPDSEVADVIVNDMFKGKNITMPSNVVTPSLRKELEKRGVPFVETDNRGRIVGGENDGVHYSKVYGKKANVKPRLGSATIGLKAAKDKVVELFHKAKSGEFNGKPQSIGTLTQEGKKFLEDLSGLKMKDKIDFVLNPSDLKHMNKDHFGDNEKDPGRNIPLTEEDLRFMVDVIMNPEQVVYGIEKMDNRKAFFFLKQAEDGTLNLAEIYSDKKGNLTAKSYYKTKKGVDQRVMEIKNSLLPTPEASSGSPLSDGKGINFFSIEQEKTAETAENVRKIADSVVNTANKLGGAEATVYSSLDDVPEEYRSEVEQGAKGWYNPATHTVHVYLPNCEDGNDAQRTVFHEKIGHEGMEVLLGGEDGVRKFANFVYRSVGKDVRGKIIDFANKYDPDWKNPDRMNVGTQEYIAHLAEEGPKTAEDFSLWTKIKHYLIKVLKKLGIRVPGLLNDKDLRYYLMKAGKALHVWDEMPMEKQEAMMKQASNAEIKDALSDGAGKGKPRQKKGESTIQYMKRVQEWRKWQNAREDKEDPEPPMFYDFDKDEAGKKEWAQLNKDWRERHHLVGEEPTGMPIRMENEEDDAYMNRIHEYEKWQAAMKDQEDPMPDMFAFEKKKQEEVKRKYEDWLAKHDLLEQQQADLDLYEGKIYPAETNPKADALEQQVMQDLAEVTSTDVSKEGAAMTVKHAVIHRRKNMEEASADDAIYINDVKNRIEKMADSGAFDKLLSDYKGKPNRAEKLAEAIPYIIEAPRRLRDLAHDLNATDAFDKGHIHIQPDDVEAIQPFVADLIAETAKMHTVLKDDKEVKVYDDPQVVSEVANKLAQAINANHQGEEGFVPIDGTDILSKHVLPLVKQQIVPVGIDYKNLSPEMKAAIDSIRDWYNYTYDWLKDNHTLREDTGYNADYVNHIWDKEKSDKQAYAMYVENRQRTKSPNEKPRTISTLMEGISVGLVPKTTDITKMMAYYSRSNIEAWVNKTMLQELSGLNVIERNEDGEIVSSDPLLSSTPPFNLEQYQYFEIPGVGPVWVYNESPKEIKVKNPITGKEKVLYSEASAGDRFGVVFETYQSSPFWKAFDTAASSAKKLELGFSGFHAGALTEVYMVQNMAEFGPKKAMANFMKYIFVDTMKYHQLPCFANPEDFQEAASHLVKFGATNDYAAADVQNMFDNMRDAMMKVQEKLKDGNKISGMVALATMPLKVATQMLSLINKGMDRALWDFLHDGLKLATYRMRADKTKERAKKKGWTEEELSRALDEDGQFVNDMFGGQHWDILGASHRTLRYAGRVLLSPDWNASTTRHFLALTGYGSIWNEATFENFKQYYQRLKHKELIPEDEGRRSRQISALLCYGIGFMVFYEGIANGINAAFRTLDEEKERKKAEEIRKTNPSYKSMYELAYPDGIKWYDYLMRGNSLGQQSKIFLGRYEDGTEMYVRHGKQFREVPEYLFNHKGELEFPGPMVQRMIGKANPMVRMTLDDINYLSDFQASHADQEIQRKYGKTIGLLYKDALYWAPFLIPSQENKEFKAVDFFFPSSKGFSPWKAQSYFKDFILSGDMEGVVMTYQSCQRNGIDAEAQIKAAIGSVKALESAEMSDGVTSLQKACKRFDAAKSITEKKKMRQKIKKFLSQSNYKAFTQKEALDMVQGYLNGDEDLKEMEKAESKYLMKAKAEDVTEDWRIQNVWNGIMETYQEYQRLKDVDKAKANAFKDSKTNKRLFAARKAISAARRKMNKAKKQMDGTNDAAKLVEIRNTRKELLKTLNGME
nr:MAG TPA: Inorganic Pyrophosphatase [Caudoviricetes sp.]